MAKTTFLSKTEIFELTGAKQLEKQRHWLSQHGYSVDVRMDGTNVILRKHLELKLGGNVPCLYDTPLNKQAIV